MDLILLLIIKICFWFIIGVTIYNKLANSKSSFFKAIFRKIQDLSFLIYF